MSESRRSSRKAYVSTGQRTAYASSLWQHTRALSVQSVPSSAYCARRMIGGLHSIGQYRTSRTNDVVEAQGTIVLDTAW
eukprot:1706129-Rhodomonas_salina.5